MKLYSRIMVLTLFIFLGSLLMCNPDTLVDKADGTLWGQIAPGEAAGRKGPLIVVAAHTNELDKIDWNRNRDELNTFGNYEINELIGGKYYIAAHQDGNRNNQRDAGEYWGGYDANGDGRLDPVTLDGGKSVRKDIAFFRSF